MSIIQAMLVVSMATVATGGLSVIMTMAEGNVQTVRTALLLKSFGVAVLFAVPAGLGAWLIAANSAP